jgi:hypothetical protein
VVSSDIHMNDHRSHARQAVYLYEHLYDMIVEPSSSDREMRDTAIAHAHGLLEKALHDRAVCLEKNSVGYEANRAARDALIAKYAAKQLDQEAAVSNKSDDNEASSGGEDPLK